VTANDGDGCPDEPLFPGLASPFTGQTAYCNGPSTATSDAIEIEVKAEPENFGLRVHGDREASSVKRVIVSIECTSDCSASAGGFLRIHGPDPKRFDLDPAHADLTANVPTNLRLVVPDNARGAAKKAFRDGRKVFALVHVEAQEPAGTFTHERDVRVRLGRRAVCGCAPPLPP
jgi:hypothetical protein